MLSVTSLSALVGVVGVVGVVAGWFHPHDAVSGVCSGSMSLEGDGRLLEPEGSRTLIYVSQKVASDSAFPFEAGEKLRITIDSEGERLIVEKGG